MNKYYLQMLRNDKSLHFLLKNNSFLKVTYNVTK